MVVEILGFILLAVLAIALIRHFMKSSPQQAGPPAALDIAKARLAEGEITPEEFAAMKDLLK
ncbi:MAG: SHOCT domain-containing protein [Syntrophomonadaceae bacterium]|nr:SHOCT domain-containing protein [Syntrophomonadaceae bacterium]